MSKRAVLILMLFGCIGTAMATDVIQEDKDRWRMYFLNVQPQLTVTDWLLPFDTRNRRDAGTVKYISTFGARRYSYVRGHIHTGVDIIPAVRSGSHTLVYAMAEGRVCSIHLDHPHQTVVVIHKLKSGEVLFTSYKHLAEVYVNNGQAVGPKVKLGRLYTRQEALKLGGNYDHLHLEIRKKFDDYGVASWATMNLSDLNKRFYDPMKFISEQVGK